MIMLFSTLLLSAPATATSLSQRSSTTIEPGVTLIEYRVSSPSTDLWVLRIDLCSSGVYMESTRATSSTQSTGSWGSAQDLTVATNGDFYRTGPLRVYGDAVGGGVRWPADQTGRDSAYSGEWYWEHYGWIAFGHDWVELSHTGWVKEHVDGLSEGWQNTDLTPSLPPGTLALVSGFPELVVEGTPMVCDSPTASSCFPDRSDMRDRNPRTAMGLTEDRQTLILAVADGRTSSNSGLYGSELADIMGQLGAYEAFNLDGGGSSQLWVDGEGTINDYDGNNSGGGARGVANHWGVFAGGRDWLPERPGHCESAAPCGSIPPPGGIIDDRDACFRSFGGREYWRSDSRGYNGGLIWTNAFESDRPDNWAWWRLELEEAGTYEVFVYADADLSVFDDVEYVVAADGTEHSLRVDPSNSSGWLSIGTFDFAAGGEQWVAVYDDQSANPGSNQHIVADAVQLVRTGEWCGDGVCAEAELCSCADCPVSEELPGNDLDDDCDGSVDEVEDSGDSSGLSDDSTLPGPPGVAKRVGGCGCASGGSDRFGFWGLLGWISLRRRPRTPPP